jgi:PncC family amidohydrolase
MPRDRELEGFSVIPGGPSRVLPGEEEFLAGDSGEREAAKVEAAAAADANAIIETLAAASRTVAAAESCTAGLVADLLARIPGASRVFWGSFVCYSADAKMRMLGVDGEIIKTHGLVSRETVCAMAKGALEKSGAWAAVSVTGLAGPEGDGSPAPVGTVWIGTALKGASVEAALFHYTGSRNVLRLKAAGEALQQILKRINRS